MIFGQDRNELRKMYVEAWQKHLAGRPMSPLEAQIADVIAEHPEYHDAVTGDDLDGDYTPGEGRTNPFLHMGLHLGVREQVATDRPAGIAAIHRELAARHGDPHARRSPLPRTPAPAVIKAVPGWSVVVIQQVKR